ncbi:MAG: glycerol kinase GlpK [Myxococcales bacterium]|nr:glycerol kinase GlpK [Myxococcales bacterium]
MARFLLAIDQGTTGSTAMVVSESAEVLGRASQEFPQHFPEPGLVEHDADEIWASVEVAIRGALEAASVTASDCAGIGITNQRETTLLWERASGKAIARAIVWQDRRTAASCAELRKAGHEALFRERTGLVLDPYFSGTKIEWLLDHVPGARARAEAGELAFGTIDSFLVHRLSGGALHLTDATNASRTLLYDIREGRWDRELMALLRVPEALLPEVRPSSEVYGHTRDLEVLPDGIPIAGIAGDQQAALFGQTCFQVGDAKCTYGTGAFLLMNTGERAVASDHGLLTTVAWRIGDATTYALEGSAFVAGSAVQWLRDQLGLIEKASDVEALAARVPSSEGVVFVPALTGLGAPHWDPDARGLICGLTRGSSAAHIARATLEGIAFQITDLVEAMAQDAGRPLSRLRVDGGASNNALLMQFQADLLAAAIDRPSCVETTALGAAYLAGLAVGIFDSQDTVAKVHRIERCFEPTMAEAAREEHRARWREAVARARTAQGAA